MTESEFQMALRLVDAMKARGVRSCDAGGFKFELWLPPLDNTPAAAPSATEATTCRCGHPEYQHNAGLCLQGCDVERCIESEGAK